MSAPHRDLPPGSQRWAEQVDALMEEVKALRAVVNRLATDARVDPSNPNAGITDPNTPPSAQPPQQTRITQHADVDAYNVADGQVLTWSQSGQAWTPQTLPPSGDFKPDPSVTAYPFFSDYITAHGTGEAATSDTSTGAYAWYGWSDAGNLDIEARGYNNHMGMFTSNQNATITLYASAAATPSFLTRVQIDAVGNLVSIGADALVLPSFATSALPTLGASEAGACAFDSTRGTLVVWTGAAWVPVGGGSSTFPVPSGAPFSFYGTDGKAEGHDTGASGQFGFVATSDSEAYLAANDATYGDANVFASAGAVTIQSDAPSTSSDWNMYSQAVVAKDGITLRATQGSGTGAGGAVTVLARWFVLPVNGTLYSASGKQGAVAYNPATNKPVFSDGTNWRYADGTLA